MDNATWFFEKSFIYHIDSNDRISGKQQDCNIKIDIPNANIRDFDSVVVLSASVPKSYYAFHTPNNTFTFRIKSSAPGSPTIALETITISPGTYSATGMANYLKTLLTDVTSGSPYVSNWNVSASLTNGYFTFSADSSDSDYKFIFDFNNNELADRLGFKNHINNFSGGTSKTLTSNEVMNMSPENDVYIRSNMARGINSNEDILIDLQGSGIPPFGKIQFYNPEPHHYTKQLNHTTQLYNFRITDENSEVLDLNGKNWTATLLFFKKSSLPDKINDLIKLIAENF